MSEEGSSGVADRLHALLVHLFGAAPQMSIEAWDGSRVDGPGDVTVQVRSRRAVRRLLWAPGERSIAYAYVLGEVEVDGDLLEATRVMFAYADVVGRGRTLDPAGRREVLRTTVLLGAVGPAPRPPEIALPGDGGYAPAGLEMAERLSPELLEAICKDVMPQRECPVLETDAEPGELVSQHYVTSPDPLSALLRSWEEVGVELVSVENVSAAYPEVLRGWAEGLLREWDQVVAVVGEQQARVWRLSLALGIENFRRRRIFGYRLTARR